jgi:hypothetical protein
MNNFTEEEQLSAMTAGICLAAVLISLTVMPYLARL